MVELVQDAYDEGSIESYEHTAAIRERPTMYIEELGPRGVMRLAFEGWGNVIDEFLAGRCKTMWTTVNEITSQITVRDDGAGIPIGKARDCITKTHTGGKFKSKAYKFKIGQNGVGMTAINALSIKTVLEIHRDKKMYYAEFSRGNLVKEEITDEPNQRITGTTISFFPDRAIFGDIGISASQYQDYLNKVAHINAGLTIKFVATLKSGATVAETYYSKNGIADYLNDVLLKKHQPILTQSIEFPEYTELVPVEVGVAVDVYGGNTSDPDQSKNNVIVEDRTMSIHAAFNWCEDMRSMSTLSFVNGIQTISEGYHVSGFKDGIADIIRDDLKSGQYISTKDPLYNYINREDYFEGMVVILIAMHERPLFDGQTKNKFSSKDYEPFARKATSLKFREWVNLNPARYKSIISQILLSAKARHAAAKARNMVKGGTQVSSLSLLTIDKYSPCKSKIPEECELFIVEGDSAGGSAKIGGNSYNQAIYRARGKPKNVYGSSDISDMLKSDARNEIKDLVTIFGCGSPKAFDVSKLRFRQINIMTDADPDGGHISSLYLGFFYQFYPELIRLGKIFIVNPPLYQFAFKKKNLYIANMEMYHRVLESTIVKEFDLFAFSGKNTKRIKDEMFFRTYLSKLRGYASCLDSLAIQTNIKAELLESILINYDNIIKHKRVRINNNELDVLFSDDENCYVIEGIYDNIYHKISMNGFLVQVCRGLVKQLKEIKYCNLVLKHKKTGSYLGPGPYKINSGMEYLISHNAAVTRFKGLGEMNPSKLWETTMNPDTRSITKVTMDTQNDEDCKRWLDILIGNDLEGRKEYYRQFL